MTQNVPAPEIHPDVTELAQKIVDEAEALVADVETLDANKWLHHADKLDVLNQQLQALLIPDTRPSEETPKSSTSKKS